VATGGEHDDRDAARLPDAAQHLDPVDARHHHVEHHDLVGAGGGEPRRALAVVHRGHGKALALEVLREHSGELDIVIRKQDRRHGADDTGRPPALATFYLALPALYGVL